MARPLKNGIDYFPVDCFSDIKTQLIEAEFGLEGYAILLKIYSAIYSDSGYYVEWNDDAVLLFAAKYRIETEKLARLVDSAVKRGIFDKIMLENFGILTSEKIQKQYFMITHKRKNVSFNPDYLLIQLPSNEKQEGKDFDDVKDNQEVCICDEQQDKQAVCICDENGKNGVSDVNNRVSSVINSVSSVHNPQSKVKESKVKESRAEESKAEDIKSEESEVNKSAHNAPSCAERRSTRPPLGRFNNVLLSAEELAALQRVYPDRFADKIERLSVYMASSGVEYRNHYAKLCEWLECDKEKDALAMQKATAKTTSYDIDELDRFEPLDFIT